MFAAEPSVIEHFSICVHVLVEETHSSSPLVDVHPLLPQRQGLLLLVVPSVFEQTGADMQMQYKELPLHALVEAKFALKTRPPSAMEQPGGVDEDNVS